MEEKEKGKKGRTEEDVSGAVKSCSDHAGSLRFISTKGSLEEAGDKTHG